MSYKYPEAWSKLCYPNRRQEVRHTIKVLSDPEYQRKAWIERVIDRDFVVGVDAEAGTLDDLGFFDKEPTGYVGVVLLNDDEFKAVRSVAKLFGEIIDSLPKDATDSKFINHPRWPELVTVAKEALAVLDRSGVPEWVEDGAESGG